MAEGALRLIFDLEVSPRQSGERLIMAKCPILRIDQL